MRALLTIVLALLPLAFSLAADKDAEELAIMEAAFRVQFESDDPGGKAGVYCVAFVTKDRKAEETFVKRFSGNTPPVKKASDCRSGGSGVYDKATGKKGMRFSADAIKWISDTEAKISVHFYDGMESGQSVALFLRKLDGKWTFGGGTLGPIR